MKEMGRFESLLNDDRLKKADPFVDTILSLLKWYQFQISAIIEIDVQISTQMGFFSLYLSVSG